MRVSNDSALVTVSCALPSKSTTVKLRHDMISSILAGENIVAPIMVTPSGDSCSKLVER